VSCPAIAAWLNADPLRYTPPNPTAVTGWTAGNLAAMLANPKYTGYMVYGRHRTRNGRRVPVPPDQWLWSPGPVHTAIVDRETCDLAQTVAEEHRSSRDGDDLNSHPATVRFYPYRSRVRCKDCQRRMAGRSYTKPAAELTYYRCPHNWASPKHVADHPDQPHTVQVAEAILDDFARRFFATRVFGPERAALLKAQFPATDAQAAADRETQEAAIKARIARIEAAQDAKIRELEDIPANPADPAGQAYRARIRARFAELHDEREQLETQLKTLAKTTPHAPDTSLLDRLPLPGDVLPEMPPQIKARLFAIFDVSICWNKTGRQATVHAEITEATLQAVHDILDPTRDSFHDTHPDQPEPVGHLTGTPWGHYVVTTIYWRADAGKELTSQQPQAPRQVRAGAGSVAVQGKHYFAGLPAVQDVHAGQQG
jgi:site-specific DNA recombinase